MLLPSLLSGASTKVNQTQPASVPKDLHAHAGTSSLFLAVLPLFAYTTRIQRIATSSLSRYNKGQPIMEDREFDALRKKLVRAGSDAVKHQASACKILENGEKECKADLYPDDGKNSILYAPAFFQMGLVFQELAYWMKGWDPLVSIIVTSPFIAATTWFLTKKIYFQDPLVVR